MDVLPATLPIPPEQDHTARLQTAIADAHPPAGETVLTPDRDAEWDRMVVAADTARRQAREELGPGASDEVIQSRAGEVMTRLLVTPPAPPAETAQPDLPPVGNGREELMSVLYGAFGNPSNYATYPGDTRTERYRAYVRDQLGGSEQAMDDFGRYEVTRVAQDGQPAGQPDIPAIPQSALTDPQPPRAGGVVAWARQKLALVRETGRTHARKLVAAAVIGVGVLQLAADAGREVQKPAPIVAAKAPIDSVSEPGVRPVPNQLPETIIPPRATPDSVRMPAWDPKTGAGSIEHIAREQLGIAGIPDSELAPSQVQRLHVETDRLLKLNRITDDTDIPAGKHIKLR